MAIGWAMSDDDIRTVRDGFPFRSNLRPSLPHEMPVQEGRRIGRTKETDSLDGGCFPDQQPNSPFFENGPADALIFLDRSVVISRRDEFMRMWLFGHPGRKLPDLLKPAPFAEVPRMNQDISPRDGVFHRRVQSMSVAEGNDRKGKARHDVITLPAREVRSTNLSRPSTARATFDLLQPFRETGHKHPDYFADPSLPVLIHGFYGEPPPIFPAFSIFPSLPHPPVGLRAFPEGGSSY